MALEGDHCVPRVAIGAGVPSVEIKAWSEAATTQMLERRMTQK